MFCESESHGIGKDLLMRKILQDFANLFCQKIYGHQLADAHFSLICHSEIETDEKSYSGPWQGKHLGIRRLLHQVVGRDPRQGSCVTSVAIHSLDRLIYPKRLLPSLPSLDLLLSTMFFLSGV